MASRQEIGRFDAGNTVIAVAQVPKVEQDFPACSQELVGHHFSLQLQDPHLIPFWHNRAHASGHGVYMTLHVLATCVEVWVELQKRVGSSMSRLEPRGQLLQPCLITQFAAHRQSLA